jgi:hypothetical protein
VAVAPALRRLLRVLELEEEQRHRALETAAGELRRLQKALAGALERERNGRSMTAASARNGMLLDRLTGVEETRLARCAAVALREGIAEMEQAVASRRGEYLAKRVERRQAETLIREAEARDAAQSGRRGQQRLDEWYLDRRQRPH